MCKNVDHGNTNNSNDDDGIDKYIENPRCARTLRPVVSAAGSATSREKSSWFKIAKPPFEIDFEVLE